MWKTWRLLLGSLTGLIFTACEQELSAPPQVSEAQPAVSAPKPAAVAVAKPQPPPAPLPKPAESPSRRLVQSAELSHEQAQRLQAYLEQKSQLGERQARARETGLVNAATQIADYAKLKTDEERVDALNLLAGSQEAEGIRFLRDVALQDSAATEVRAAALEALAETPRVEHLPAVDKALTSADADLRLAAVWLLSRIQSEQALPLWQKVMRDPNPEIIQLGFEQLPEAAPALQVSVSALALQRREPWMTEQALLLLGGVNSKPAVEAIIPCLDDPVSGDMAQSNLVFLTGEFFDSSAQAREWWQNNQHSLGPDLQPKE